MLEDLVTRSILVVILLSGVPLLAASLVGLLVSIVQAATQIQEQSFLFSLKASVVIALIYVFSGLALDILSELLTESLLAIVHLGSMS